MKLKKVLAILLSASLIGGSLCACGDKLVNKEALVAAAIQNKTDEEILTDVVTKVACSSGSSEAKKQETVYVKTDATGNVDSVIVSNWLKNVDNTKELEDESDLKDIKNVKGKETYKAEGTKLTWETEGEDIYYQGTTDKELPVDVNISYELEGKAVSAEELAGQSGHVVVTLDYTNNCKNTVTIEDKEETIYTPFAVVSAMALNEEKFSNVSVSNGTVVSDGKRDVVVGMAFPGLVDSLNGSRVDDEDLLNEIEEQIKIPDRVVVEADVTDFESGMILTLVTSDITEALGLDAINLESNSSVSDIKDSMKEFTDAGNELVDGTAKLRDGAQELSDGTSELVTGTGDLYKGVVDYTDGVGKVADGAVQLDKGAGDLDEGAKAVANGVGEVKNGIASLSEGASSLEAGAKQVSDGAATVSSKVSELSAGASQVSAGVDTLVGQMGTIAQGVGTAAGAAGQISSGIDQVVAATSTVTDPASIDTSSISVTGTVSGETASAAMLQYITADQLVAAGLTEEQAQAVLSMVSTVSANVIPGIVDNATDATAKQVAASAAANAANETKAQIKAAITTQGESGQSLQSGAKALSDSLSSSYASMTSEESQTKLTALSQGASAVADGAGKLSEGTKTLATGAESLYEGTKKVGDGADKLSSGLDKLSDGAGKLSDGTSTLKEGTSKLVAGTNELTSNSGKLVDGSKALADGSSQLVDGIRQLLDGTIKLNEGMVKFNDEGVDKLAKIFDTDLSGMQERIQAIADAGRAYNTFSGSAAGEESTVKFIIESAEIKK
ncbi:MAG: hypothetical protein K6A74_01165 [Lachnospiraceae bacterium]|nr:hypothetical protein [Lachnospiraceae bacterium]